MRVLQKVLVTGASGFIGTHLCQRLSSLGAEVHGVSRTKRLNGPIDIKWWDADLRNEAEVYSLMQSIKPEIVYHLSACVTGSRNPEMVLPTFHSNLESTVNLLAALNDVGCGRIVLAGSMEEPALLQIDLSSISPYAASKLASSIYGRMFHALYNLPVVILHVFMVYGPGQMDVQKLVPYVTLSLLKNTAPKLTSGSRAIDWIYIDDVIDGLIACAQAPEISGRTLDIGSGSLTTVRRVVEELGVLIKTNIDPEYGVYPDRIYEAVRAADKDESFNLLGWKSKVDLREGLKRTVRWYEYQFGRGVFK
jgi:UDP-glucose 4-epimerase